MCVSAVYYRMGGGGSGGRCGGRGFVGIASHTAGSEWLLLLQRHADDTEGFDFDLGIEVQVNEKNGRKDDGGMYSGGDHCFLKLFSIGII